MIKAVTVNQPEAGLIALPDHLGGVRILNRGSPPPLKLGSRHHLAIHASCEQGAAVEERKSYAKNVLQRDGYPVSDQMFDVSGHIVAICNIIGWVERAPDGSFRQEHRFSYNRCRQDMSLRVDTENAEETRYLNDWFFKRPHTAFPGGFRVFYRDIHRELSDWWIGPYAWLVTRVRALETPVEARGRTGLWTLKERQTREACTQAGVPTPSRFLAPWEAHKGG